MVHSRATLRGAGGPSPLDLASVLGVAETLDYEKELTGSSTAVETSQSVKVAAIMWRQKEIHESNNM